MQPDYAKAVDPVFLALLEVRKRVERGGSQRPAEERAFLKKQVERAEAVLGGGDEWELAKYALTCWIDLTLITQPWEGRQWWEDNPLEREYFFQRKAHTEFFQRAKRAAESTKRNALEVYYLCVVLGFRGLYEEPNCAEIAAELHLPPDIDSWARETAASLRLGGGLPPIIERPRPLEGAPPLEGRLSLIRTLLFGPLLLAVPVGIAVYRLFLAGD